MFSTEHFIWIGLCAAFVAGMLIFCIRKKVSLKVAGYVMSGICLCSESSKILSNMVESPQGGMYLDPAALPFHLCSLMLFGVLYITFGKEGRCKQRLIDFVAVMGTLGSICAILIPTNGTDFTTVLAYQCFVYSWRTAVVFAVPDFERQGKAGAEGHGQQYRYAAFAGGGCFVCERSPFRLWDKFYVSGAAAHGGSAISQSGAGVVCIFSASAASGAGVGIPVPYPFYSASKEYRQPKHCLLKKNEDPILHAERQRENTVQPLRDRTVFNMYHRVT